MQFFIISYEEISIEDRLAILEDKLPSLHYLDDFHCTGKFNQSDIQFRFDKYAWEARIVWHYCQPYHSKAFYQHFKANALIESSKQYEGTKKQKLQLEAKELLESCIEIYELLNNSTSLELPAYMYHQNNNCIKDLTKIKNEY